MFLMVFLGFSKRPRKRRTGCCDFENTETRLQFAFRTPENCGDFSALFWPILRFPQQNLAHCDLKMQRFFCDCEILGRKAEELRNGTLPSSSSGTPPRVSPVVFRQSPQQFWGNSNRARGGGGPVAGLGSCKFGRPLLRMLVSPLLWHTHRAETKG